MLRFKQVFLKLLAVTHRQNRASLGTLAAASLVIPAVREIGGAMMYRDRLAVLRHAVLLTARPCNAFLFHVLNGSNSPYRVHVVLYATSVIIILIGGVQLGLMDVVVFPARVLLDIPVNLQLGT
jgi:hypothetical protein